MPTFVLKKYEPTETNPEHVTSEQTPDGSADPKAAEKQEAFIEVSASDSIGKIIVQALYKAIPNIDITEREQAETKEDQPTKVISTEDINTNPVDTLQSVKGSKAVLILGDGFKTRKDEWFLQSLENLNIQVFYTVGSFTRYVQSKLG